MIRSMKLYLTLLLSVFVCACSTGVDLIHVFDQSASVPLNKFLQFANVAQNVTNSVVAATGYYDPDTNPDGARVSLITFVCKPTKTSNRTETILWQSGDAALVSLKFDNMRNKSPLKNGKTCFTYAALAVQELQDTDRQTNVVIYSDADIHDRDSDTVTGFTSAVNDNGGKIYGVGIGDDTNLDTFAKLTGDTDTVFQKQNLEVIDQLTAVVKENNGLTGVSQGTATVVVKTADNQELDSDICIGQPLLLELSSDQIMSNQTLSCQYTLLDTGATIGPVSATVEEGKARCEYVNLQSETDNVKIDILSGSDTIASTDLALSRRFCLNFAIQSPGSGAFIPLSDEEVFFNFVGCWGLQVSGLAQASGASVDYIVNVLQETNVSCAVQDGSDVLFSSPAVLNDAFLECQLDPVAIGVGNFSIGLLVGDTGVGFEDFSATDHANVCAQGEVRPENGEACIGSQSMLVIKGRSISSVIEAGGNVSCILPDEKVAAVATSDTTLECPLPAKYMLMKVTGVQLEVPGRDNVDLSIIDYPLATTCVELITSGEEDYCAGVPIAIALQGRSVGSLLSTFPNATFTCSYDGIDAGEVLVGSAEDVLCPAPPVWNPWTEEGRSASNVTSVSLRVDGEETITVPLPEVPICLDVDSHGVDRRLSTIATPLPSCYPSCCRRENVTILFAGRTVEVLTEFPERLRCAFMTTSNTTVYSPVSFPSEDVIQCDPVQGWSLDDSDSGDYSSVTVEVLDETLTAVVFELKSQPYEPSSASETCIQATFESIACLEEDSRTVSFAGPTLSAIASSGSLLDSINCSTGIASESTEGLECKVGQDVGTMALDIMGLGSVLFSVAVTTRGTCFTPIEAVTSCEDNLFNSVVVLQNPQASDLSQYTCVFTGATSDTETAPVVTESSTLTCSVQGASEPFESMFLVHNPTEIRAFEGTIRIDGDTCENSRGITQSPTVGDDEEFTWWPIVVVVALLMLCCILILCFVCLRRKKKPEDEEEEIEDETAKEVSDAERGGIKTTPEQPQPREEPPLVDIPLETPVAVFEPDDDVEAFVFDREHPSYNSYAILNVDARKSTESTESSDSKDAGLVKNWFKGRIVRRNSDLTSYHVKLANEVEEKFVPTECIRRLNRDASNSVESDHPDWRPPIRPGVLKDNSTEFLNPVQKPIEYRTFPSKQFEIVVDKSKGLGINLGLTETTAADGGRFIITEFKDVASGGWGPVEGCGLVGLGDELLQVNGDPISHLTFNAMEKKFSESGDTIRLRFGRSHEEARNLHVA